MITVRSADKSDLAGLHLLMAESEIELPARHPEMGGEELMEKLVYIAGDMGSFDSAYVVAEYHGSLIGYLFAHVQRYPAGRPRLVAQVEEIFVTRNMRGKGAGLLLIDEGIRRAAERGLTRIEVGSYYGRTDRRWKILGFEPCSVIGYAETGSAKRMIERAKHIGKGRT